MSWRGYIKTDEHGNIRQFTMSIDPQPEGIEINDPLLIEDISLHQDQYIVLDGKIQKKPVAMFVADKKTILADGIDVARVHLSGMPDHYKQSKIFVGNQEATISRGEKLEITSEDAIPIMVALREPGVYCLPLWVNAKAV